MANMLEIYYRAGFHSPIRPDHAPTMVGAREVINGYGKSRKVFAFSYMMGIMDARNIA